MDTNILVYAHTDFDITKQTIAQKSITENFSFISTQVLQELANTLYRKFNHTWAEIETVLTDAIHNNNLSINGEDTIRNACRIAQRYGFAFYDCLIISSALECNCSFLYSEDLNHGQIIDEKLKIINPFL